LCRGPGSHAMTCVHCCKVGAKGFASQYDQQSYARRVGARKRLIEQVRIMPMRLVRPSALSTAAIGKASRDCATAWRKQTRRVIQHQSDQLGWPRSLLVGEQVGKSHRWDGWASWSRFARVGGQFLAALCEVFSRNTQRSSPKIGAEQVSTPSSRVSRCRSRAQEPAYVAINLETQARLGWLPLLWINNRRGPGPEPASARCASIRPGGLPANRYSARASGIAL